MENNKDIGKWMHEQLDGAKKTADSALWEKLETSLDEQDRKRKKVRWVWLLSGGAVMALLLFLLLKNGGQSAVNDPQESSTTETPWAGETPDHHEEGIITFDMIEQLDDSTKNVYKKVVDSILASEGTLLTVNTDSTERDDPASNSPADLWNTGENISVKTKYQYFNSKTGELIETTDKKVIDSLLNSALQEADSLIKKNN